MATNRQQHQSALHFNHLFNDDQSEEVGCDLNNVSCVLLPLRQLPMTVSWACFRHSITTDKMRTNLSCVKLLVITEQPVYDRQAADEESEHGTPHGFQLPADDRCWRVYLDIASRDASFCVTHPAASAASVSSAACLSGIYCLS